MKKTSVLMSELNNSSLFTNLAEFVQTVKAKVLQGFAIVGQIGSKLPDDNIYQLTIEGYRIVEITDDEVDTVKNLVQLAVGKVSINGFEVQDAVLIGESDTAKLPAINSTLHIQRQWNENKKVYFNKIVLSEVKPSIETPEQELARLKAAMVKK